MINGIMEGVVVDTNDPQQMGRLKIWVPALDGDMYNIVDLPWAIYASPLAGQTLDYKAGPESSVTKGLVSYGFWAIPKTGALCLVNFLYGDPNRRVYAGSYFRDHGNRSLPNGRNRADLSKTPISDTFNPIQPLTDNLAAQFNSKFDASEAKTRGVYERQVSQDKTIKDGVEGYQVNTANPTGENNTPAYDPQTYSITTPGHHSIVFQDNPENGRVRIKTASGHQVILDDANERIYISTAKGASWLEMDQDGRIHVYSNASINFSCAGDFNVAAGGNFNVSAANVNIGASKNTKIGGCSSTHISGGTMNLDSGGVFNILAAGSIIGSGSEIHLNGPKASSAACPSGPSVVPQHEPWVRAGSRIKRNVNWKA